MRIALYNRHRIYFTSALMDLTYAFVVGAVAVYAVELGASPMQLGLIGSVGAAVYTVASYLGGMLVERCSRRLMILLTAAGCALACLGLTGAASLGKIYLFFALFNAALGAFWPTMQSLVADSRHRRNLAGTLGTFCISWSLGFTIGHFAAGYLTELSSTLPFGWALGTLLLILLVSGTLSDAEGAERTGSADFLINLTPERRRLWRRFLISGWLANFALVFIQATLKMLFPKLALEVDQLSRTTLGLLLALIHAGQFAVFVLVRYWHSWQYNRRIYLLTQLISLPGTALLVLGGNTLLYGLGMLLIGVASGFTYTSSIYYSVSRPPEERSRTGAHEAMIGLGILLGPLAGGWVAGRWDLHAPYLLCLLLTVALLAGQVWLLYHPATAAPAQSRD